MQCPHCGAELPDDDLFCEECGRPLKNPNAPVCLCGAPDGDLDEDGYCLQCGRRCRPAPGDHVEFEMDSDFAAVSDRGKQHHRNEDRCAIALYEDTRLLIVCDGVSSSADPQTASQAAVDAVLSSLCEDGDINRALESAAHAVAYLDAEAGSAPSTTAVAAVVRQGQIQVGWLGDSRAYWVDADNARQLTTDHSWLNDVVSAGEMSYAEALQSPRAHGITRWLGADAGQDIQPEFVDFEAIGPGCLLLCTDGLWNYLSGPEDLMLLLNSAVTETALETARRLVEFANEKGGHDNISVALLRFPG